MTWGGGAHQNSAVIAGFFESDGNGASAFLPAQFPPLIVVGLVVVAGACFALAVCGRLARRRRDRQLDVVFGRVPEWEPLPWHPGQDDAA